MYANKGLVNTSESSSEGPIVTDPVVAEGKIFYAQYCAQCHGQIDSTTKRGRDLLTIQNALRDMPAMAAISLTATEVQAIAAALKIEVTAKKFACNDQATRGLSNPAVRRLSKTEVINTVKVVLGGTLAIDAVLNERL